MDQSAKSGSVAFGNGAVLTRDSAREIQSFRGIMIGIALSTVLWAPLGMVVLRLFH